QGRCKQPSTGGLRILRRIVAQQQARGVLIHQVVSPSSVERHEIMLCAIQKLEYQLTWESRRVEIVAVSRVRFQKIELDEIIHAFVRIGVIVFVRIPLQNISGVQK